MNLILDKFPTHVAKTNNKVKQNTYWKINSQGIYNGYITKFTRAVVIKNIHNYIIDEIKKQDFQKLDTPVQLVLGIFIPINYASVRRKKDGSISWKPAKEGYMPSNDEDNISWIWEKCIKDCLTELKIWEEDNSYFCRGTNSLIHFVDSLEDRKIEISFNEVNPIKEAAVKAINQFLI